MYKIYAPLLALTLAAGLSSCKKENENTGIKVTPSTYASLPEAYDDVDVNAVTFNVDATNGSFFRGPMGSRFVFPANAFMTPTGRPVTGTVQVAVREFLKPSDAIFSRVLPVSGTESLISGGAAWVFATQNGNTVILRPGMTYTVHMPQRFGLPAFPGFGYYLGTNVDSSAALALVNFVADGGGSIGTLADTVSVTSDSLAYIAAGLQLGFPETDTFNITVSGASLPTTPGAGNAAVYVIYRGVNSVVPILPFVGATKQNVILGDFEMSIVAMALVNGDLHYGVANVTPETGKTYTVNISKTTPEEARKAIDALQ